MSPGDKPPRLGRGLLLRGLIAGVVIVLATASAVSATVMLQVDDIINIIEREGRAPIIIPEIDRADAGSAQTIMILGSDRRYGDRKLGLKPRSDTIILVRLDPDKSVIAVTSVPRDLLVEIPGLGLSKINAAYELGGERATVRTVKRLLSTPERPFRINHVITVDFSGFRRVIDYIGCVYVDIDRDYFNDVSGPGGYATIDIDPGYQKLCGRDSLDYVRYRHGDNDLVRAARQQDFLRQIRNQHGIRRLSSPAPSNLRKLARIFARYFDSDKGLRQKKQIFALAKTVLFTSANPVREVQFRVSDAGDGSNLVASPAQLDETVDEFLEARGSATPRKTSEPTVQERRSIRLRARNKRPAAIKGLEEARAEGEDQAIVAARDIDFPFFFPTVRTVGSGYVGQAPRTYKIKDELGRRHDAYRLVIAKNVVGEYYGVQGTTWRDPPILDDPAEVVVRNGKRLRIYRDGRRIRLVAWRTKRAVYWVSNTLTQSLTGPQMIGIAASLRRFGRDR
ncbi:MAG TPA: LCP family protein [Solirubrobacteraceae bacterium]|nr:LCP family protein [Solirubrobacteraceae bacterium]